MMFYFKQVEDGKITSVEAKSVNVASPGFVKAIKTEYDGFIASLPIPEPVIGRNLTQEFDSLKVELKEKGYIE